MPTFEVVVEGTAREIYTVEAETAEEATETWWQGGNQPSISEVFDAEVVDVEEVED